MRIVISFDEGCSGNFLAAMMTDSKINSFFRIDTNKNLLDYSIVPNIDFIPNKLKNVIITHENNIERIKEKLSPKKIIRISTKTGVFTAIYNVFLKKHVGEDRTTVMEQWAVNKNYGYNMTMEHLKDYYQKFTEVKDYTDAIIFDFGNFYSKDKLLDFFKENDLPLKNINLVDDYIKNQTPLLLSMPTSTSMEDIVESIPDVYFHLNPWAACYCIFCFEHNNNIHESLRKWSIDSVPFLNKESLISLTKQYEYHTSR